MTQYGVNLADITVMQKGNHPMMFLLNPHLTDDLFEVGTRIDGHGLRLTIDHDQLCRVMALIMASDMHATACRFYHNEHETPRGWTAIPARTVSSMIAAAHVALLTPQE